MKNTLQEAEKLISKIAGELEDAYAIASGKEKGTMGKLELYVGLAQYYCYELEKLITIVKYCDKKDENKAILEYNIPVLHLSRFLSDIATFLSGEARLSLSEAEAILNSSVEIAIDLQKSILAIKSQ
jgi:hypothetical protein